MVQKILKKRENNHKKIKISFNKFIRINWIEIIDLVFTRNDLIDLI
jgi:hypothetical protein